MSECAKIDVAEFKEALIKANDALKLPPLSDELINNLAVYYEKIIELNEQINLTAITVPADFAVKNVVDSLLAWDEEILAPILAPLSRGDSPRSGQGGANRSTVNYIDVGTGAGFPAVPLVLAHGSLDATLLDARNKRLKVIENIITESLPTIKSRLIFLHGRAETIGHEKANREKYGLATARAVGKTAVIAEYLLPLLKIGGVAVLLKGPGGEDELKEASEIISILGGKVAAVKNCVLPTHEQDKRTIIYLQKIKATPPKFPRPPAKISS